MSRPHRPERGNQPRRGVPSRGTGATRTPRGRRHLATAAAFTLVTGLVPTVAMSVAPISVLLPTAQAAPVGQGFNLNRSDLRFILKQIKISEQHASTATPSNPCGTLVGAGPDQIPGTGNGRDLPWGLRTVDGTCNNLYAGRGDWGSADQLFPRLVPAQFQGAETGDPDGPGPAAARPTSYAQKTGTVFDSEPRTVSNLIVDQTVGNPAAVEAADPTPTTEGSTLVIPNVAPDVGLSAPYNSVFTLFGQFFDHGLDLVTKGQHTVLVPLKPDDPLYDPASRTNFMALSRATNQPGPDGILGTNDDVQEATNTTTAYIDQNQTYTSHPSHQVFLREFELNAQGEPVETGQLVEGPGADGLAGTTDDDGLAPWSAVKTQARDLLGIQLRDSDVLNVPLLATDAYGNFTRGPNGYPQIATSAGLVEGDPAANSGEGITIPANALRTNHAFLDDIAHHAVPRGDRNPADGPGPVEDLAPDPSAGTGDDSNPATYDDEMLGAHFIAGDGRTNENIGLTAVHHVFHSEHNRLVDDIQHVISTQDPTMLAEWQVSPGVWDGDRLFQAARFVNEMEYQHLAFEEFARKVQPMVNLFGANGTGYTPDVNPAIKAEFAHAVYRFGHSMLTETVARRNADGSTNDVGLIDAFLDPPEFTDGGPAGQLDPDQAAGSIFRGMSRQVGSEMDEFVTEALRNNLLGLPLDLATINMVRARETGTPGLNAARREFYALTNNSALAPYESWADMSYNLRHRTSLTNFVAAYGSHPSISGGPTARRDAAVAILHGAEGPDAVLGTPDDPTAPPPADRLDFVNSTGQWANSPNGATTTGVDRIDLWVGGLAEKPMVFGGMLGSTFNYVFETQMEDLQDGDRFYYLSRTAGLNLLTQLEGNSFAELISRNTDVAGLPADSFSRPDMVFEVPALGTSGPITDDPSTTDWNESVELTRMANGTIRYGGPAHTVWNGTDAGPSADDRLWASEGDDTIRGNGGDDWMQGGDGVDNLIGGLGDDILNDLAGDDTLKGGDGDDALSSGQGFGADLNQGGRGKDFVIGGNDMTETFAGPDDDFVYAGDAQDTVFGDDGDDWIEGGRGPFSLLQGDNGAPFADDPNEPGHDVLQGYGGENDYDAEGGDDIMLLGAGIQRNEGMQGFDWATHKGDLVPGDSDMRFTGLLPPSVETNVDRFDLVESLSGWKFDDKLRGDSRTATEGEPPIAPDHVLTADGIARIDGFQGLLGAGVTSFNGGNILIGGAGNDEIEGRGGDDLIDGDAWLDVQLRAPDPATASTTDTQLVDTMGALRADVFAGRIDPGDITIVRSIKSAPAGGDVDTAVFSDVEANYTITPNSDGTTTVAHSGGTGADGTDTLRNMEQMVFGAVVAETVPDAPTVGTATGGNGSATVTFTPPAFDGGADITEFQVQVLTGTTVVRTETGIAPTATSATIGGLSNGTAYGFRVIAVNSVGASVASATSNVVTPAAPAPATRPGAPTIGTASAGARSATVRWTPGADGGSPITEYRVQVRTGTTVVRTVTGVAASASSTVVTGLTNGTQYNFRVRAVNAVGVGPLSAASNAVRPAAAVPATAPGAPVIGNAVAGAGGGAITATANWSAPASDGGSPVTGYRVFALRMTAAGAVAQTIQSNVRPATARSLQMTLPRLGNYRFQVTAINAVGTSPRSARSNLVAGR